MNFPSTRAGREDEAGDTLVELLVTIVILGIAVVGIIGALGNATLSSDLQRRSADGDTVLRSFAAYVLSKPYVPCNPSPPTLTSYSSGFVVAAPVAGYAPSVTAVEYWNGNVPLDASSSFSGSCASTGDKGLQVVRLSVTTPGGRGSQSISVYKRAT
jgi:type II secretory pathway pseudopilin PulG